jgi:hypothetical protein
MAMGSTQPLTEMSTSSISWGCVRLTTYHHPVPLSRNLGSITSWNPLGLPRPVTGLLKNNTQEHLLSVSPRLETSNTYPRDCIARHLSHSTVDANRWFAVCYDMPTGKESPTCRSSLIPQSTYVFSSRILWLWIFPLLYLILWPRRVLSNPNALTTVYRISLNQLGVSWLSPLYYYFLSCDTNSKYLYPYSCS